MEIILFILCIWIDMLLCWFLFLFLVTERLDPDTSGIISTFCDHSFQCSCTSKWTYLSCTVSWFFILKNIFAFFIVLVSVSMISVRSFLLHLIWLGHMLIEIGVFCHIFHIGVMFLLILYVLLGLSILPTARWQNGLFYLWITRESLGLFDMWFYGLWKVKSIVVVSSLSC